MSRITNLSSALALLLLTTCQSCADGSSIAEGGLASDVDPVDVGTDAASDAASADGEPAAETADAAAADTAAGEDAGGADTTLLPAECDRAGRVVTFETSDGVALEADYVPAARDGGPAIVLLHMIPPSWTRASYPERVRDALAATGAAVLNVDRRGAGGSTGEPVDAYEGPGGRLDVEAAVRFLLDDTACALDPERIMLVGASNGTTSVMDYAVAHAEELPAPARIAWLSPGTYTENQHAVDDHQQTLDALPVLIVHPGSEPWAERFAEAPSAWRIVRIDDGAHGTQNFDDGPNESLQLGALVDWATAPGGAR